MGNRKLSGKPDELLASDLVMDWHSSQGEVVTLLVGSCQGNLVKLWLGGPLKKNYLSMFFCY